MTSAGDREAGSGDAGSEEQATGLYTETLARLYMRQGYGAKALVIYRHLIDRQPANADLRARAAALERQLAAGGLGDAEHAGGDGGEGDESHRSTRTRRARLIARLEGWLAQLRHQRQVSPTMRE